MSVNCDRVCRLCLSSRGELLPIFPTTSSDGSGPPALASRIQACVSVQINQDDELPTRVCRKCLDNVNNWHIFKKICERSQSKLCIQNLQSKQNLMKAKDGSLLEENIKIKSEPMSDEAYDDAVVIDASYPGFEQNGTSSKVQPEGPPILASLGLTPRSDKKVLDPRLDWCRVDAILNIIEDDDMVDSLQLTEESDAIQYSDHNSDTDGDLIQNVDDDFIDCKDGYITKNHQLLAKAPKVSHSAVAKKIKKSVKRNKRRAKNPFHCPKPKHAWYHIFSKELLESIVDFTNAYIVLHSGAEKLTNIEELECLIGILYLHGIYRAVYHKRAQMWSDHFGLKVVIESMTIDRFEFLLQNLRFEYVMNMEFDELDLIKPVHKVFDMFALNCRNGYDIGSLVVIDEKVVPSYGPCPFRFKFQRKHLNSGIKIVTLTDPSNFYVGNIDIVLDKSELGPDDVVKRVVQHLAGTGRTIIMDSWFTSIALMSYLLNEYHLYTIAALSPSDSLIPPVFMSDHRLNKTFLSAFIDEEISLTSYINSNRQGINILANHPKYYKRSHSGNATAVSVYKVNQSAGEVLDVLTNYYTTLQHTNSWFLSLFFFMLDIASVNAQVIWLSQRNANLVQRRNFIQDLAIGLMEPHSNANPKSGGKEPSKSNVGNIKAIYENRSTASTRLRCKFCSEHFKRDRKTRIKCVCCGWAICRYHQSHICTSCESRVLHNV